MNPEEYMRRNAQIGEVHTAGGVPAFMGDLARNAVQPLSDVAPGIGDYRAAQRGNQFFSQMSEPGMLNKGMNALAGAAEYATTIPGIGEFAALGKMAGAGLGALAGITKTRMFDDFMPFTKKTGVADIDDMLEKPEYYATAKNKKAAIRYMSPDEYIRRSQRGFELQQNASNQVTGNAVKATSVEDLAKGRNDTFEIDEFDEYGTNKRVQQFMQDMIDGDKFPMLSIDFSSNYGPFAQEGLHRAVAAKHLGISEIPVAMVSKIRQADMPSVPKPQPMTIPDSVYRMDGWDEQGADNVLNQILGDFK